MSFAHKTRSEQKVEHFERLKRPLTDAESVELQRAMHAVYERDRRCNALRRHEAEERAMLKRVEAEAGIGSALA